jgi:hypothetical protein
MRNERREGSSKLLLRMFFSGFKTIRTFSAVLFSAITKLNDIVTSFASTADPFEHDEDVPIFAMREIFNKELSDKNICAIVSCSVENIHLPKAQSCLKRLYS